MKTPSVYNSMPVTPSRRLLRRETARISWIASSDNCRDPPLTYSISNMIFLAPIKGMVSDTFAPTRAHYGTDIVAPKGSIIRATQGGTVLVATWSADTGHMLAIQHANNVVSFYKHNASLLKKTGDMVGAGEGIAIIGNTGEMTEGPHLHFELWFNGQAINPERYIEFKN